MRSILKYLTGRLLITILLIVAQIVLIVSIFTHLWNGSIYIQCILNIISIVYVLIVFNNDTNPAFKLSWAILILVFPLGWILYIVFHRNSFSKKEVLKYSDCLDLTAPYSTKDTATIEAISKQDTDVAKLFKYVQNTCNMNVFSNTYTKYYPCGEHFFLDFMEDLKSANKYIFLEYFIISHGTMWNSILNVLKDKVLQGVEVRLMYDDMGTISLLNYDYSNRLNSLGIKTVVFNPVRLLPSSSINFRDHRKICVIDGSIAYTGGLNLSDEYINVKSRFGYWKDTAIKLQGSGVHSMVLMYLQLWNYASYDDSHTNISKYFGSPSITSCGYVQPFYDNPFNQCLVSKYAYMSIINQAKEYVYICTPYLILDNEMITALTIASKSGVDVRIITPHVPDKEYVYMVTRSNYPKLIKAGVRIFEYKEGFIHSKTIVSDDKYAIVGTANFDFRSFYMHFEDGILMYNTQAVAQLTNDCKEVFSKLSIEVSYNDCISTPWNVRLLQLLLNLISPIM